MKPWRVIRIGTLLLVLLAVVATQWQSGRELTAWDGPLWITVHPLVAKSGNGAARYADRVDADDFEAVSRFLRREGRRFGHDLERPLKFQVAPVGSGRPPSPPVGGTWWQVGLWSLHSRWWAWQQSRNDGLPKAHVRMFVLYEPLRAGLQLDTSIGMRKGAYGVVNAIGSRAAHDRNQLVFAHELLHVLGATDKYDLASGQPDPEVGLAEPDRRPRYPQRYAEIMAGRIALSPRRWDMPRSLDQVIVGPVTAREIGWVR